MPLDFMSESEMREFAKLHIRRYFSSSDVPDETLVDEKYVDMCLRTDISSGMRIAYDAMENSGRFTDKSDISHPIEKDVRFVIKTLERMSRVVPQELSAGILLMHLEIFEGIPVTGSITGAESLLSEPQATNIP